MSPSDPVSRRGFLNQSLVAAGTAGVLAGTVAAAPPQEGAAAKPPAESAPAKATTLPCGTLGRAKISRLLLGGNLIGGYMHCRDLKYVNSLFRAYATDAKIMETIALAEQHGINTVFETGGNFVQQYNRLHGGHMQFIPHIEIKTSWSSREQADHIKQQVDTGAIALYVWGVSSDPLIRDGQVNVLARAVEMAKKHDLPVGVGCHSLLVPMQCEKQASPATSTSRRCTRRLSLGHAQGAAEIRLAPGARVSTTICGAPIPEETIEYMQTVSKPWIAFKVLAAGAIRRPGFPYAFKNGADFIAVGMFDFQVKADAELAERAIRHHQKRERPWRA